MKKQNKKVKTKTVGARKPSDRETMPEKLLQSEARYEVILRSALDCIISIDHQGKIIEFSAAAEKTFGYSRDKAIGKPMAELIIPPSLRERHYQGLKHYLASGEGPVLNKRVEMIAMRADGSEFPAELTVTSIGTEDRPVFTGYVRDITKQKQAETQIQLHLKREAILREIQQAINSTLDLQGILNVFLEKIGILLPYPVVTLRLLNKQTGELEPAACRNLAEQEWKTGLQEGGRGVSRIVFESRTALVIGPPMRDPRIRHPEFWARQGITSYLGIPLIAKDEALGVISFQAKDQHRFSEDEIKLLTTIAGQAALVIYNSRLYEEAKAAKEKLEMDIVRRIKVETTLRQVEKKYRAIFDNAVEGIFQSTPGGRFITANSALARILGYNSPEELLATITNISSQIYTEPDRRREFQKLVEQFQAVRGFEFEARRKDGSRIWLSINARAVRDESGAFLYYEGFVQDITEHRWAKTELQRYARRLAGMSRRLLEVQETERRHLARELHDEIGQALTALKINLQANLLAMQALPAAGSVKSRVTDNIGIVERLLQQTRDLALDLRPAILDDLGLIPAVRWYLDHRARQTGLDAQLIIDPVEIPVPPHIGTSCFRIVQEALTNVIRHARAKRVRVELHRLDGQLHVTIADDGVGFDVHAARERPAQGRSLGLVGMEERALLAGGQIELKSEPLKGTELRVSFPLSPTPPSPEQEA